MGIHSSDDGDRERADDRCRVGPHPAPPRECLCRLFDEHPDAERQAIVGGTLGGLMGFKPTVSV